MTNLTVLLASILLPTLATMGLPTSVKLPDSHPLILRATSCAADVVEVVDSLPEHQRTLWAPVLYVWALKEGGCYADPPGSSDDRAACGVTQVHEPQKVIAGATCAKVRADRKLGLQVGLTLMIQLAKKCGTIGGGMTAYSTNGACTGGWVLPLVKHRLKLAGVGVTEPWTNE